LKMMDHVAIMKKSWNLLPKILSGEKTIESRWYKTKGEAWGKVKKGDMVYFKNSGEPVGLKAEVAKALQFENLKLAMIREIMKKYGKEIGLSDFHGFYQWAKDKKYCVLIFLKDVREVEAFSINKAGFGLVRAWLTVKNIKTIKI